MIDSGWFLLGAPWDCSGSARGEARAPGALRMAGLVDRVDVDLGDAATVIGSSRRDETTGVRALPDTIAAAHALAGALRAGMGTYPGRRPLVLGVVGLWSIDGHPDYFDAPGSETGETADLQLAF